MGTFIENYAAELRAHVEQQKQLHKLKQEAEAKAKVAQSTQQTRPVKPLDDQIQELMRTLPPQLRNRPWSMAELVQQLTGKYRDHPHAQRVGESLRRLGWRRERRWEKGFDGVRIWVPRCAVWGGQGRDCGSGGGRV